MSTGALVVMVMVLGVVWGGTAIALIAAWRQERRQVSSDDDSIT